MIGRYSVYQFGLLQLGFWAFVSTVSFFSLTLWWRVRRRRRLGAVALDGLLLAWRGRDRLRLDGMVGFLLFKWMVE